MGGRSLILVGVTASLIASAAAHSQTATGSQPITPPPVLPDVPPLLPSAPPAELPHYSGATASPGQFAPAPNPGPVTGYGPGGTAPIPGAPANPPYSYGPLR